jgi:glutathione S-transferase
VPVAAPVVRCARFALKEKHMLKVYGHPMSTCVRKVLATLAEHGAPHEFVLVDLMTGTHKQPEHLARQPFGQVPVIEDGDFRLYESRAICKYLDEKHGGKLVPKDLKAKALMEQWLSVETSNFTPHAMKFIFHHIFKRTQQEETLAEAGSKISDALGIMDKHLATNKFFAGNDFSIADISFLPYVEYAMMTPVKDMVAVHPNVMGWWERSSSRPSWQKAIGK